MPETLSFQTLFVAEMCLIGVILVASVAVAYAFRRFRLIELKLAGMILLGNVALIGFALWRYETAFWLVLLWGVGSLLLAAAFWAAAFLALNVIVDRIGRGN